MKFYSPESRPFACKGSERTVTSKIRIELRHLKTKNNLLKHTQVVSRCALYFTKCCFSEAKEFCILISSNSMN